MQVRRCAHVMIEPRERLDFDLALITSGGTGLRAVIEWVALAPHCDTEIVLSPSEVAVLGALSPSQWMALDELAQSHPRDTLQSLLASKLLIGDDDSDAAMRDADQALRDAHWRGLDAIAHRYSRWHEVDTVEAQRRFGEETDQTFLQRLGDAPPQIRERAEPAQRLPLTAAGDSALDALLARRVTCRNYDLVKKLSLADFSTAMYHAFGARAVDEYAPGIFLLKKGAPSAGGLHPVEAYVLVQRVDGIAPGLYHYHPAAHALEPIREMDTAELAALAKNCLGGQPYFAQAHVVIALAGRFARNFWKYRNHAKAYRAVILDAGHLSQTLYLAATELGLGAFVTAGVNEVQIEQAFGLEPMSEGPLAMCGFGIRGAQRREVEFDPNHAVWPPG
ncbi:MAG: putative peptide maturation dehydrogenase [Rudaea sp.]